jgi:TDG/mug DNA glycosylase family protein
MDRATVEIYEREARAYAERRSAQHLERAAALAARRLPGLPLADLGCGPGGYLATLGGSGPVVGLDAAGAMIALARERAPDAPAVQADLERLPFRRGALGAAWARNSYLHVRKVHLPLALAHLHAALAVSAPVTLSVLSGDSEGPWPDDDFPGRMFSAWEPGHLEDVLTGAGFADVRVEVDGDTWADVRRARTLPDTVGPSMRALVCGLNPSVTAADAGYGFAGPSNRFWPAAVAAGLVARPRDPVAALTVDGVGMTDLVKRATPRAAELGPAEYHAGIAPVGRLVGWLQPEVVVFVGLAGVRAAIDRYATAGELPGGFAGVPAYVMPSTSGLNAHSRPAELVEHLRAALELTDG